MENPSTISMMELGQLYGIAVKGKRQTDGMMVWKTGEAPRKPDGRRVQCIRALGAALNALVSQSRALTAESAATFQTELQPAAFHIASGSMPRSGPTERRGQQPSAWTAALARRIYDEL